MRIRCRPAESTRRSTRHRKNAAKVASKWQTKSGVRRAKPTRVIGFLASSGRSTTVHEASPHYSMRVQFRGRRVAFTLGTGNKEAAAVRAARLYGELLAGGLDAVLTKYRAHTPEKPQEIASIGQWIAAAGKVFDGKPATFGGYARALRFIASEILSVAKNKRRYGTHAGRGLPEGDRCRAAGHLFPRGSPGLANRLREAGRGQPGVAALRSHLLQFCSPAGQGAVRAQDLEIHCTASHCQIPSPFAGVDLYPRESMRYQSKLDPALLLRAASGGAFRN